MTWVKIDDRFHWDSTVEELSDRAYRLYVGALCYCNWHETDGFIRASQLPLIAQRIRGQQRDRALQNLLNSGLWELVGGGYQIANYLKYQPSKAQLEDRRHQMRELGRAGGVASGLKRSGSSATVEAPRLTDTLEARPVPSRPVPSRPVPEEVTKAPLLHIALPAVVPFQERAETKLAVWWQEFNGGRISEHDKQAAAAFIVDYPRLGLAGIKARITEHAEWRRENKKKPLGKLEFYRDTLNSQEEHLADAGMTRPRAGVTN